MENKIYKCQICGNTSKYKYQIDGKVVCQKHYKIFKQNGRFGSVELKCDICGKTLKRKLKADGKIVCEKHYKQFKKHGKFLDNVQRTQLDRNEFIISGDITYIQLYDKHYQKVAQAIIDTRLLDKVKHIKWRYSNYGYVYNNSKSSMFLHRKLMDINSDEKNTYVDHINGNRLDNRLSNLRLCNKSENQMNVPKYKGVYKNGDKFIAKIKINQKQKHLGIFITEKEALYCRWYAERVLFGEFASNKLEPDIHKTRKKEIQRLVNMKVQRL